MSDSDSDEEKRTSVPRGTCWICGESTKNPNAKQHKKCRERHKEKKKKKKKERKEKRKKKRKKEAEELAVKEAKVAKAAKARKKIAKKRKRDEETSNTKKTGKKSNSTTSSTKAKKQKVTASKTSKASKATKATKASPKEALPAFQEDLKNASVFKVALFDRVSSPDLQVQDGDAWRYASIHVHKKNQHVVIWYGGFEYEGLGLKKSKSYRLEGLPKNDIFNGANGQLLDGDGDAIECKR
jgi:hypothetical protein